MLTNLNKHITTYFPFLKKAKLLIAVSGGIDSVVLTHLLHQLSFDIALAHCNFNLRGKESSKDEIFVKKLAKKFKNDFFVTQFETKKYAKENKLSIQEAARNLRYNWFNKLVLENQFDYILTAHNLNDNLETFLINLTRGTGLKGLLGIPKKNKNVVRPLLEFSRKEITEFALKNNVKWREDKSNATLKYVRNKIRHQVIPVLESINTNLLDSFKNTLEHLKGSDEISNDLIRSKFNPKISVHSIFNIQHSIFKIKDILETLNPKAYLYKIFKNYGFTEWNDLLNLLTTQSGKQLFSKTHRLIKDREYLLLVKIDSIPNTKNLIINKNDNRFNIQHLTFKIKSNSFSDNQNLQETVFDKNLLKFPLKVRKWKKGDYFYPIGMTGKKKLSKFFKDEKYSLLEKENIWLLLSNNQIIWIIGKRQDNRFKITKTTTQIIEISLMTKTDIN
ncbi:MAG: tRNA lysidine(34) synthetase TilS [Flavobacteriaceae bacterium]|nr:tRNA lysidine(34) synthetase TilS [Flavobacteriaceae bacterium]